MEQQFHLIDVDDKGKRGVFQFRIDIENEMKADIILYSTGKLYLSSSPRIDKKAFSELEGRVIGIAERCIDTLFDKRPVTALRAASILDFACELDPQNTIIEWYA